MDVLEARYNFAKDNGSDIFEHIPTLRKYASQCESVVEMGVRRAVSSWALLLGVKESPFEKKELICVDIEPINPEIQSVLSIAETVGVNCQFLQADSAKVDLPEVDLLFIDTWHVYGHLKRELNKHHSRVKKWIIMHDTTVDEWVGESIRMGYDCEAQAKAFGYPLEEIKRGLWCAISEFLFNSDQWILKERFFNNNGLTVLERVN